MKTSISQIYKILKETKVDNGLLLCRGIECINCPFAVLKGNKDSREYVDACSINSRNIQYSRKNFLRYIVRKFPLVLIEEESE